MTNHLHRGDLPAHVTFKGSIAVDSETMGLRIDRDRLCLVQLSAGDGDAHLVQIVPGQQPERLAAVRVTPRPTGEGVHVAIDVTREGQDVLEPVEVRVEDKDGGAHTLIWNTRGTAKTLEVDLPAGLSSVEIDPRSRLLETAVGSLRSYDDPRFDDRQPRRWRFLYQGFGAFVGNIAMGVLFGWLYSRTGRVLPLVIAHFAIDAAIFVGYPWAAATFSWL